MLLVLVWFVVVIWLWIACGFVYLIAMLVGLGVVWFMFVVDVCVLLFWFRCIDVVSVECLFVVYRGRCSFSLVFVVV